MFDGINFPSPLDEELFDSWLENGRQSKLNHQYLAVIWDELNSEYQPVYAENREKLNELKIQKKSDLRESLIAAYDLYSESRVI